jgi:hypothetical protein
MKQQSLVVMLSAFGLAGCSKPAVSAAPPSFQPPTATEVFNLRSKCQQLGEALDESTPYGANWRRDLTTNYNPRTNRCYVEMTDSNDTTKEYLQNLYDGQTKDLLAYTKTHGDACCRTGSVGMIFMDNNVDTLSDCKTGGDCGYDKVNEFIDAKMKRDDAVTQ